MNAPLVRRSPAHRAVVVGSVDLTPRMRRVTIRAQSLAGVSLRPAQDVELLALLTDGTFECVDLELSLGKSGVEEERAREHEPDEHRETDREPCHSATPRHDREWRGDGPALSERRATGAER